MVSDLSIPRPAYNAAHSPAGPAPTMMTSYSRLPCSAMLPKFQSWGIALPRQGPRQLRAEVSRLEFHFGLLGPGESFQCRGTHDHRTVAIATAAMQQRRRCLNQSLKDSGLVFLNNRTPHGFQRLVREPVLAGVEELTGVLEVATALLRGHIGPRLSRFTAP